VLFPMCSMRGFETPHKVHYFCIHLRFECITPERIRRARSWRPPKLADPLENQAKIEGVSGHAFGGLKAVDMLPDARSTFDRILLRHNTPDIKLCCCRRIKCGDRRS
jgi:hypothetical protein